MRTDALPVDLAELPPGPESSVVLAGLDPRRVANADTVKVLAARYRQLAHDQARLLEAMVLVGRADPDDLDGTRRLRTVGDWAAGEIAAALALTGVAADRELTFADMVVARLPLVHTALSAGMIDRAKAWLFADHLTDLPPDQIAAICVALVPLARPLTTGQLRARLVRMLHDIDPEQARRRYQRAVRERAVIGYLAPDGTVSMTASGLPADEAAVACERLDALAHTAQRSGHGGSLAQIQTDLFLGMLDGTFHHLDESAIIAALLRRARSEDMDHPDDDLDGSAAAAIPETASAEATAPETVTAETVTAESAGSGPGSGATSPDRARRRSGVEVRIGLGTLLGLDERCGEIAGLGPVLPGIARKLVATQDRGAEWRFAISDADGYLVFAGTTRRRPASSTTRRGCQGGVVEPHVDAETLLRLASDDIQCGPWVGVVADIAGQYADRAHALGLLGRRIDDRFARTALARHVEVRDRTCCFPGCRRPARKVDKDHTVGYAHGGATAPGNLGPLCGRHHRYKSNGWWRLAQPEAGRFHWTSPLARTYRIRGEPVRPPSVPPRPRSHISPSTGSARRLPGPILRRTPHRSAPHASTEPARVPDEPPF